ncbi:MAG TPA: hypothetical protein VES67_10145 [Vicinamibacterales bacterium]|nr:hypothetical protein [Vicinamibacterales bacterium]
MNGTVRKNRSTRRRFAAILLVIATVAAYPLTATTFISAEPIPTGDVIGQSALSTILSAGYPNLERWSNRLLNDCDTVQNVIDTLTANAAITTVTSANTSFRVAAGGFEGVTNPSFVFKVQDSGPGAVSAADVNVVSNALGYVLSQGGTAHFSPDNAKAYAFSLDYAVVTFAGTLTGVQAKDFFDHLGTIDADLWSGLFAGFTQIAFGNSASNNSMLFLKPAATKQQFITGLSTAASTTSGATYVTVKNNGAPTTAKAGIAFPENDWIAFPGGTQYLSQLGNASSQLLTELAALRLQHLEAVANLLEAIEDGNVTDYLNSQFACPVR